MNDIKLLNKLVWDNRRGEMFSFYGSEMNTLKVLKEICETAEEVKLSSPDPTNSRDFQYIFHYSDVEGKSIEPTFCLFIYILHNFDYVNYGTSIRNCWTEGLGTEFVTLMRKLDIEQIYEAWNLEEE